MSASTSPSEQDTTVQIGHKDGRVILNMYGTSEVAPSFIAWTPAEAREVARQLMQAAATAEIRS